MASINELLNLDITDVQKMTRQELAKVVTQLNSAANKRLKRLELIDRGTLSPAYQKATERAQRFSVKGKDLNALRNEYKAVSSFLGAKSSSVGGWHKIRKQTHERIGGEFKTEAQEKKFWKAYRRMEKQEYGAVNIVGSDEAQRLLHREVTDHSKDGRRSISEIIDATIQKLDEEYERMQSEDEDEYDDFFTMDGEDEYI